MDVEPRPILALLMLFGAIWSDVRIRRVRNHYWVPFAVAAGVLWAADLAAGRSMRVEAIGALSATALLYVSWWLGVFGGADAKGLMVLAWLWPGTPAVLGARTVPVLDTLMNGTLLVLVLPVGFLAWNAARGRFRFPAMALGVEAGLDAARSRHVWPMQRMERGVLRWRFWQRPGASLDAAYGALAAAGVRRVWVTPKVPFMVPLAAGALVAWIGGNLFLRAML